MNRLLYIVYDIWHLDVFCKGLNLEIQGNTFESQ